MKTSIVLGLFALMVVAAPVMAEENASFLALKDLPEQAQAVDQAVDLVQPLTDTELATIEGGQVCILCTGTNLAVPLNLGILNITGGDFGQTAGTGPQSAIFQPVM